MATENEASCQSCTSDPNFAVICSFLERFSVQCGIPHPTFAELQEMIEDTEEVPQALIDLHVKLLRKARKSFSTEKWERTLIRFSHSYSSQDAWELERFGYKNARVAVKLRILKMLLDAQFDLNMKFKTDINKLTAEELRGEPLGRDKMGYNYWCQFDPTANVRVYKEDQDEETWELVAKDREGLVSLISCLSSGENIAGLEDLLNEDSNSQDLEKPVIDTGQQLKEGTNDGDSDIKNKNEVDKEINGLGVELPDRLNTVNGSVVVNDEKKINSDASETEQQLVKTELELKENNGLEAVNGIDTSDKKENTTAILDTSNNTEEKPPTSISALEGKSVAVEEENKKHISISDKNKKQNSDKVRAEFDQCLTKSKSVADNNKHVIPEVESLSEVAVKAISTVKQNTNIKSCVEETPPLNVKTFYEKPLKSNQNGKEKPSTPLLDNSKEKPFGITLVNPKEKSSAPVLVNSKEKPALVNSKEKPSVPTLVNSKEKSSTPAEINLKEKPSAPAVMNKKNSLGPSDNSTALPLSSNKKNEIAPDIVSTLASSDKNKDLSVEKFDGKVKSSSKDLIEKKTISKEVLVVKSISVQQSTIAKPVSKEQSVDKKSVSNEQSADINSFARERPAEIHLVSSDLPISKCVKKGDLDVRVIPKKNSDKKSPASNVQEPDAIPRIHSDSKPALNLSMNCSDPKLGAGIKDYDQSQIDTILKRPVRQLNSKCVDLSNRRPTERMVPDGIKEIELRGLMKSNTAMYRDGKSAPGSKLDEIFKLKRNLNSAINHPESQPLPAHFVGTSKNKLLEKMRMNMNESLTMVGFSESGKFTQPKNQISKPMPKDAEDLSVSKLKRGGPEDLSISAPKKPLLDKEIAEPEVSEAIEEPVMLVKGEGSGKDCNTGNPGRENEKLESNVKKDDSLKTDGQVKSENTSSVNQINTSKGDSKKSGDECENSSVKSCSKQILSTNSLPIENNDEIKCKDICSNTKESNSSTGRKCEAESSKVADKKVPKLWSIDTICSSDSMSKSSEALETVSVPASECKNIVSKGGKVNIDDEQTNNMTTEVVLEKQKVGGHNKESVLVSKKPILEGNSKDLELDVVPVPLLDSLSDSRAKTVKELSDNNELKCSNESIITVERGPTTMKETSSTSKYDKKKESQTTGFFFGPGCVKMSNVVDLGGNSVESSKIQDQQNLKFENIPKGLIDPLESVKTRKKTLDRDDSEESPHEPKKTRVNTDSCSSDKECFSKTLGVDIKSKETDVISLTIKTNEKEKVCAEQVIQMQSHYNNVNRIVSDKTVVDQTGNELSSADVIKDSIETFAVKSPATPQSIQKECSSSTLTSMSSDSEVKSSSLNSKFGHSHASDLKTSINSKSLKNDNLVSEKSSEVRSVEQKNLQQQDSKNEAVEQKNLVQDSKNKDSIEKLSCSLQIKDCSDKKSVKQLDNEECSSKNRKAVVNFKGENEVLNESDLRKKTENRSVSQLVNKSIDGNNENKYSVKIIESRNVATEDKTIDSSNKPDYSRLMKADCKEKISGDITLAVSREQMSSNRVHECMVLKGESESNSEKTGSEIVSSSSEKLEENKKNVEKSSSDTMTLVKAYKEIDSKNLSMKSATVKTASKNNDKFIDSSSSSSKFPENVEEKGSYSSTVSTKTDDGKVCLIDKDSQAMGKFTTKDESIGKNYEISKCVEKVVEKDYAAVKDNKIAKPVEELVKEDEPTDKGNQISKNVENISDKDSSTDEVDKTAKSVRKLPGNDQPLGKGNKITNTVGKIKAVDDDYKITSTTKNLSKVDEPINIDNKITKIEGKLAVNDKVIDRDDINKTTKTMEEHVEKDKTSKTIEELPEKDSKSINKDDKTTKAIEKLTEKDKSVGKNDKATTIEKLVEKDKTIDKDDKTKKIAEKEKLIENPKEEDKTAMTLGKLEKKEPLKQCIPGKAATTLGKLEKKEPLKQCIPVKALMDVGENENKCTETIDVKSKSIVLKSDNLFGEAKSDKFFRENTEGVSEKQMDDTSGKNTLIGKVTIRNMSEILKPDVVDCIKKTDEKPSNKPEIISKDTKIDENLTSDVKPVSKISLKPLSKILKPELIAAQSSLVEPQTSLLKGNKNISEKNNLNSSSSLSSKINEPGNPCRVDGDTIANKLRKTAQEVVESERNVVNVPNEIRDKRVRKPVQKKNIKGSPEINVSSKLNNVVAGKNSNSIEQNKVLENVKSTEKIPSNITAGNLNVDKQSKLEQFKLETELNILAVRQELKAKRSNLPKVDVDEIHDFEKPPVRNTRSRQKTVMSASVKISPKTRKQNLKAKQEVQDDDVQIIPEKDPLALSDEDTSQRQQNDLASKKEGTSAEFSLSTFSLDSLPAKEKQHSSLNREGNDKTKITPKENILSGNRKRRSSRRLASKETDDDVDPEKEKDDEFEGEEEEDEEEEAGGKRRKVKGKRTPDVNFRRSVEAKRGRKSSSSEDDGPVPETFEGAFANFVSKKNRTAALQAPPARGSKRNRCNKSQKNSIDIKDDSETGATTKETDKEIKEREKEDLKEKKKPAPRASRLEIELGINPNSIAKEDDANESEGRSVRASRRIAQIKIREQAERRQIEDALRDDDKKINKKDRSKEKKSSLSPSSGKSHEVNKSKESKSKSSSKKSKKKDDDPPCILEIPVVDEKSKKKKKKKRCPARAFDGRNPWASTSDSSTSNEEEEEEEEHYDIEEEEEEELMLKSDHEFSPESDLEKDEEYIAPLRRARTAQKDEKDEGVEDDEGPDYPCQKCEKSDHPEWILLCDKCDNGWHASCLRPNLVLIPEGDWYCPPCQHITLVQKLQESLRHYDRETKRRVNEELRRKRLAYVGISLDNVLPMATQEKSQKHAADLFSEESSSSDEGSSDDESDQSDEPVYQLRQRRQTLFSYRFNEYDDLINSAIQDELDAKGVKKSVLAEAAPVSSETPAVENVSESVEVKTNEEGEPKETEKVDLDKKEVSEKPEEKDGDYKDEDEEDDEEEEEEIPRVVPRGRKTLSSGRKKHRRLNCLDVSSGDDDDGSDEDFKGSSSEEEEEEENDDYSDDSEGGRLRPVRRSSRTRVSRFDKEFINDDSDDSDGPRKKKTRRVWQESDSEESDKTWGKHKKKKSWGSSPRSRSNRRSKKKKKHRRSRHRILDSDEEVEKVPKRKKPKIKYGLDDPADDLPSRRTRGRKMNYQEVMGSDTEEEILKKTTKRIISDEDEFKVEEELKEKQQNSDDSESGAEAENGDNVGSIVNGKSEVNQNEDIEDEEDEDGDEPEDDEEEDEDDDEEDEDEEEENEEDDSENDDQPLDNNDLSSKEESSISKKVSKETLKCKVKTDSEIPNDVNKNDKQPLDKSTLPDDQSSIKPVVSSDRKDNESSLKEMPSLKMRISNQSVTSINDTTCSKISKSVIPEDKIASSGVSVGLRQKLQLALSKKLKGLHAETKSLASENNSDDELEETSEDLLEEDMDELEDEEEEEEVEDIEGEDEEDEEEEILEEGQIPKKIANQLQNVQIMLKRTDVNIGVSRKDVCDASEKIDTARPVAESMTATSVAASSSASSAITTSAAAPPPPLPPPPLPSVPEPEKMMGIRVVSPLKLMANPPPAVTQPSYVRMPGAITQQPGPRPPGSIPEGATPPPKRRGRGRGKKQLAQEKAAQEQLAAERLAQDHQPQPLSTGGSVIRGMLQSGQPQSFPSVPRHYAPGQLPAPRSDAVGRGVQFPTMIRGRMPFPVQQFNPNPPNRLGRPPTQIFHSSHHPLDPSPSGGGPINILSPSSKADSTSVVSSPQGKSTPPHPTYHRPQNPSSGLRFPTPDSNNTRHSLPFISSSQTSIRPPGSYPSYHHPSSFHYSVTGYPTIIGEEALPPAAYQGSPSQFSEQYSETNPVTSDTSNSKSYDDEVSGGEFGGLVSYFSSQREDDLET